jgi:hypothetical protein
MGLKSKKKASSGGNKDFVEQAPIEGGTYPCRVVRILELGKQPQRPYKGAEKEPVDMLDLTYELTDEFMLDENGEEMLDKPRWYSEDFPYYSFDCKDAKCNKRLAAIDPKDKVDGDWALIPGAPVNVTFVQNVKGDKTYINVASVSAMRPKDAKEVAPLVNPTQVFDLDEPDMDIFNALPKWMQDKIKGNLDFKGSPLDLALNGEADPEEEEDEEEQQEEKPKKKAPKKRQPAPKEEEPEDEDDDDEDKPW